MHKRVDFIKSDKARSDYKLSAIKDPLPSDSLHTNKFDKTSYQGSQSNDKVIEIVLFVKIFPLLTYSKCFSVIIINVIRSKTYLFS